MNRFGQTTLRKVKPNLNQNIARSLGGKKPAPFSPFSLGEFTNRYIFDRTSSEPVALHLDNGVGIGKYITKRGGRMYLDCVSV